MTNIAVLGRPMCDLLGGAVRDRVALMGEISWRYDRPGGGDDTCAEDLVEQCEQLHAELGVKTVKMKGGVVDPDVEVRVMELCRQRMGPNFGLRIDANGVWSVATAVRIGRRLEPLGLEYFEDPAWGIEGLAAVRRQVRIPIATNMYPAKFDDLGPAIRLGAMDVVLTDLHYWEGPRGVKDLCAVLRTFNLGVGMHSGAEFGVEMAAMLNCGHSGNGLFWVIEDATPEQKLKAEAELARDYLEAVRRSSSSRRKIVGESEGIRKVLKMIQSIAGTSASVLICGESGTGKELVAESIHINSRRAGKPMVVVNCATLQETLLESELFGYKQGAFTGAVRDKRGLVEIADGGTLFIDEVSEMSPAVQAKMLHVIEHGKFRRLGCTEDRQTDIRIIAATNKDLSKEVRAGRFREDLLYRFDVIRVTVPPLRERREDIPLIAEHFLLHSAVTPGRPKRLTPRALDALMLYKWPGNVRELSNVIERAIILTGDQMAIDEEHLLLSTGKATGQVRPLDELQINEIDKALAVTRGNKSRAAKLLGITRQTLITRLKKRPIQ